MTTNIVETKWHSWHNGGMAKGCALCVQGRKLVLFITGLCPQRCFYCPVSEQKFGSDVVYANEWKILDPANPTELLEEARLTGAKGTGITGGDPLVKVDRCCEYIRLLKKEFGREFHVHLYTPLALVSEESLKKLYDAGLDEIRFHPDLDDRKLWPRIELALKYGWDVGIEIPAIPDYRDKTKTLIDFVAGKVKFLNMNELELSDTQTKHYRLQELNYKPKDSMSYGVQGSKEMAMEMLEYAKTKGLIGYFCTAKLKDAIQMTNRMKLRAENVALSFDRKTGEGTLIRGAAYLPELAPGFSYREKLKNANAKQMIAKLGELCKKLRDALHTKDVIVDTVKLRLILSQDILRKNSKKVKDLGLLPAIVEEHPTADAIETEVEFL